MNDTPRWLIWLLAGILFVTRPRLALAVLAWCRAQAEGYEV